jgi:hypothetical protein
MHNMDAVLPSLFVVAVVVVLIAWSWQFHFWSNSPTARRSRSPLWLGFTATAASGLFLIAGIIGYNLIVSRRLSAGTAWADDVIWWQVAVGAALVPVAIYLLQRGVRDVSRSLGRA